jgi:hypothetical protein
MKKMTPMNAARRLANGRAANALIYRPSCRRQVRTNSQM